MKKLNIYISRQIFVGFLLVTFSLMSILWLTQSLRFVELVTNNSPSLATSAAKTVPARQLKAIAETPVCNKE